MSLKTWRYDLHVFYNKPAVRSFLKFLLFPVAIYYMLGGKRRRSLDNLASTNSSAATEKKERKKRGILLSSYSSNNHEIVEYSLLNHEKYCTAHNLSFMYDNEPYSPYINCNLVCNLLQAFDFVVIIGTDIIFTDFNKDIRDFIVGPIVIQDEGTGTTNGDFVIFSDAEAVKRLQSLMEDNAYSSTQEALNTIVSDDLKVLPIHTMQAPATYGNEGHPEIEHILWREGDFSMHFHQPFKDANVMNKKESMQRFFNEHPEWR